MHPYIDPKTLFHFVYSFHSSLTPKPKEWSWVVMRCEPMRFQVLSEDKEKVIHGLLFSFACLYTSSCYFFLINSFYLFHKLFLGGGAMSWTPAKGKTKVNARFCMSSLLLHKKTISIPPPSLLVCLPSTLK